MVFPIMERLNSIVLGFVLFLFLFPWKVLAEEDAPARSKEEPVINAVPGGDMVDRDGMRDYAQSVVVSSDEIKMSGATNLEELLTELPALSLRGNKDSHPTGKGIVRAEIRNLGTGRMLVLVNGRRTIGAGGPTVDMSIIPVNMVERVEIILGGASAVYGADAVAGVVNVVIKKELNGVEVGANGGISTEWDGEKVGAYATMGHSTEKGDVLLGFNWSHRSPVFQRDRDWPHPPCEAVQYNEQGGVDYICGSLTTPGGNGYFHGANLQYQVDAPSGWIFGSNGDYHALDPFYVGQADYDAYNYGKEMVLSGQSDRFHLYTSGDYRLGKYATAYLEGLVAYQMHGGRYAGEPVGNGTESYPGALMVPLSNPFIPSSFWTGVIDYYGIDWGSQYIDMDKRVNDIGARIFNTTTNHFRVVAGLRGNLGPNQSYDLYFGYGNYTAIDKLNNSVDVQRFHASLDPEVCYATPGCIVANIFGAGTMQEEVRDFIGFDNVETQRWDTIDGALRYFLSLFELPGGKFRTVFGGDVRFERGHSELDSKDQDGLSNTRNYESTDGSYNAQEAFIDMSVPFFGHMPFTYLLSLDLTGRASHFSSFGSVFTYRGQLSWAPWRDLLFRGAYSTSFRAPSITELHKGTHSEQNLLEDPCGNWGQSDDAYLQQQCQAAGLSADFTPMGNYYRSEVGGNPNLGPELSRTMSFGVVLAPTFVPESMPIAVTFDHYRTWITDVIDPIGGQAILDNCYTDPALSDYCDFIERGEDGNINSISMTYKNISEIYTAGFDMAFHLGFPVWPGGSADLGFQGNFLADYVESSPEVDYSEEDVEPDDYAGVIFARSGGLPKRRFLTTISLAGSFWRLTNRLRFIQGMTIDRTDLETHPVYNVTSIYYWDISGMVEIGEFDIVVGAKNLLGKEPPYLPGSAHNANPQVYDLIGRYLYANVSYAFK